ncbi:hypothetical protein L1987_30518 [Smallanthus sonchifolius]|uniref:Uncharacterized protein n=1 Tax=Smallanthus sonchifolius TaxID=185202 RepID=A0ACB9I3Q4_9ASTR|nr:hypothetical protein L1987_30518 [Smallanthus sonchifolius]
MAGRFCIREHTPQATVDEFYVAFGQQQQEELMISAEDRNEQEDQTLFSDFMDDDFDPLFDNERDHMNEHIHNNNDG